MALFADTMRRLAAEGNSIERIAAFVENMESGAKPPRKGRDGSPRAELEAVVDSMRAQALLALPFETMDRAELTRELARIGQMEGAA